MFSRQKNRANASIGSTDSALNPHLPMRLSIERREVRDVVVIDLDGQLVMGNETIAFSECVHQLVAAERLMILVNLEGIDFADSSGIGELIVGLTRVKRAGGQFKLAKASKMVHEILQITHLLNVLELYTSEEEALASFTAVQ